MRCLAGPVLTMCTHTERGGWRKLISAEDWNKTRFSINNIADNKAKIEIEREREKRKIPNKKRGEDGNNHATRVVAAVVICHA